jgi:hypothetical protein
LGEIEKNAWMGVQKVVDTLVVIEEARKNLGAVKV